MQRPPNPVSPYGRSGGIFLINPTDRNVKDYVAPAPGYGPLDAREARAPAVIRGATVPAYDPTGVSASTATVASLAPATAVHGAADATCTLTGTGYTTSTVVLLDGVPATTTYISATSVSCVVPVSTSPIKTLVVSVVKPGERPSGSRNFTIT